MLPVITVAPPESPINWHSDIPDPLAGLSGTLSLAPVLLSIAFASVEFAPAGAENPDGIYSCLLHCYWYPEPGHLVADPAHPGPAMAYF